MNLFGNQARMLCSLVWIGATWGLGPGTAWSHEQSEDQVQAEGVLDSADCQLLVSPFSVPRTLIDLAPQFRYVWKGEVIARFDNADLLERRDVQRILLRETEKQIQALELRMREMDAERRVHLEEEYQALKTEFAAQQTAWEQTLESIRRCVVVAPDAGVLLHGRRFRDHLDPWQEPLEEGSQVKSRQVFLRIANPAVLQTTLLVDRHQARQLKRGTPVTAQYQGAASTELLGRIHSIGDEPIDSTHPSARDRIAIIVRFRQAPADAKLGSWVMVVLKHGGCPSEEVRRGDK